MVDRAVGDGRPNGSLSVTRSCGTLEAVASIEEPAGALFMLTAWTLEHIIREGEDEADAIEVSVSFEEGAKRTVEGLEVALDLEAAREDIWR